MSIRLTALALLTGAALLTITPVQAGGPVVVEETTLIEGRTEGQKIGAAPVIATLIIACLILCGGSDDAPAPIKPVDPCNGC